MHNFSTNLRQFLSPEIKEKIISSLPFRIYSRFLLHQKIIRYSVEITTKCNVNCSMYTRLEMLNKNKLVIGEIKPKILNKIFSDMKKFIKNDYQVVFAPMGLGEPLMSRNWKNIFSQAKKISKNIYIVLVTNGVLLNEETARELIKIGIDEISISLNVNNRSDYQKYMRAADNYENIKNNIINLLKIRNHKKNSNTKIFIQYLDYKNQPKKFTKNIAEWRKLMRDSDKCYVHPIVNQAGFKKKGITQKIVSAYPCISPLSRVAIRINGDMYPCDPCFYGGNTRIKELYLGNISKNSFFDLINNRQSKIYDILNLMKNGDYSSLPTCQRCNTYTLSSNPFFCLPFGIKINSKKWF